MLAAGLNIRRENVEEFREKLTAFYANHTPVAEEGLSPDLIIDSRQLLTMKCVESLDLLEPCGNENPRPLFGLIDARLQEVVPIGGGKHVRMRVEKFGQMYDCVWFGQVAGEIGVTAGDRIDLAFHPQVSEFRGRRNVQLVVQDLRPTDVAGFCRHILTTGHAPGVYIDRGELARIWRSLEGLSPLRLGLGRLGKLEPRLHSAKISLGLRVLQELGLCQLRFAEDDIYILLINNGMKADLMQSPSWRKHHR